MAEAPSPRNASELKSFLGMINYYQKYLLNLEIILTPLHELMREEAHWKWGKKSKKHLKSPRNV